MADMDMAGGEEARVPPSLTKELLSDRLFKQACKDEGITLDELHAADELTEQIGKTQQLLESGIISDQEFREKIFNILGGGPEDIEPTLARYKNRHEGLVQTVLDAMARLKAEADEQLPVPPEIDEEVFFSEYFQKACDLYSLTLRDVCKFERTKAEYSRLQRLKADERIMANEYAVKVEQLFGVPELRADETLGNLHQAQLELIEKLLVSMQQIKHAEWEAEHAAKIAQQKRDEYVAQLRQQVEQRIAKERRKADEAVARRRAALEKVLIHRGVEHTMLKVEKKDRQMAAPGLQKKAARQNLSLFLKTTAGQERKKLWLIDRNTKAQNKTKFAGMSATNRSDVENDSLIPQRPMSAIEKRELLLQEKADQIRLKESRKLRLSEMVKKEREAELQKKVHQANLKRIQRENALKKMHWAKEQRAQHLQSKLEIDDSRAAAFKEVQEQQRRAIAAIQKQAREDEAMLKAMLIRAERDFDYRPEGAGIDFDKIKRHVSARASKLVKTSESFITPELEVPIPRTRPPSAAPAETPNTSHNNSRRHIRPSSAPPSGPASGGQSQMPQRPATAFSRSSRPGTAKGRPGKASRLRGMPEDEIPDDISEISDEEDTDSLRMARLEKLRIEQGKNLYHIVREEHELEKERLRMLSAVQPKKQAQLNRLFEQEREEASQRIMRVAAENEMVLLQEMALMAAADEPVFEDE